MVKKDRFDHTQEDFGDAIGVDIDKIKSFVDKNSEVFSSDKKSETIERIYNSKLNKIEAIVAGFMVGRMSLGNIEKLIKKIVEKSGSDAEVVSDNMHINPEWFE